MTSLARQGLLALGLLTAQAPAAQQIEPSFDPVFAALRVTCSWAGPAAAGLFAMLDEIDDVGSRMVTIDTVVGNPTEINSVGSRLVTVNMEPPGAGEITSIGSRLVTVNKEPANSTAIEFVGSRLLTVQYDPFRNEDVGTRMFTLDGTMALTLNVDFQDLSNPALTPTQVDIDLLRNEAGESVIASFAATLVNGSVTINSPTRQILYARVRQQGTWLGKKNLVDLRSAPATTTVPMYNGDCDANNVIDLTDYTTVALAFNADPNAGNWNVTADLNRDDIVDLTDYTIVALNFNRVGD